MRIMACEFHTVKWKHLLVTIALCRKLRNITFVWRKPIMQLMTLTDQNLLINAGNSRGYVHSLRQRVPSTTINEPSQVHTADSAQVTHIAPIIRNN